MPNPTVFLVFAVIGIAAGALIVAKRKGRGLLMAWAFLSFSLLSFTLALEGPDWLKVTFGIAVGVFLLGDVAMRAIDKARQEP